MYKVRAGNLEARAVGWLNHGAPAGILESLVLLGIFLTVDAGSVL